MLSVFMCLLYGILAFLELGLYIAITSVLFIYKFSLCCSLVVVVVFPFFCLFVF